MSDFIDRQKAIQALGEKPVGNTDWDLGCRNQWEWDTEILRTLPTAEPERKWIPVTEKLHGTDINVLVTVLDDSGDTSWSYTSVGWLTPDGKYWVVDNEVCYGVVAWMSLPEPWKGE